MTDAKELSRNRVTRSELIHSTRTAMAALVSLSVASLFRLPEAYWAAVTALIVMQSTVGATFTISKQRLAGTALGAAAGGMLASYLKPNALAFSIVIFLMGLICAVLELDRAAYRFAGITLAIVALVARTQSVWVIAAHRFVEVSLGIGVGLILTAVWPEARPAADRDQNSTW
jgi:uncharacterized membrane protein YccC